MTVRHEIQEADQVDKNFKTHKISSHAMERKYLADRGAKPPSRFCSFAKCGHSLVGEPPFNKDVAHKNKKPEEKWKADKIVIKNYDKTGLNLLLDSKGAIATKLKKPTYGDKVIMCHCWQNSSQHWQVGLNVPLQTSFHPNWSTFLWCCNIAKKTMVLKYW
jgi:hypothetical protein